MKRKKIMRISALLVSMVMMMTSVASAFPEEPMSVASYSFKGPSDPAEWGDAQWIWGNENPGTTDSTNRNVVQYFRRDFTLNQRIIAGNAQFTGIAAGRGVGFTT